MNKWSIKGFDALSKGTLGNAGQNLYVSKKGVLQRIWQFDVNSDGYVDILVANSHGYNEHPYANIISDPAGTPVIQNVLTQDGQAGQVADINGDGFDDLVIATANDGHHLDLTSYVYFGGKDGITENRKIDLAARCCTCATVGDVDGDGKKEICYLIEDGSICRRFRENKRIRIYHQSDLGFQMDAYQDYSVLQNPEDPTESDYIMWFMCADIDGDGCDDLYCRTAHGKWLILWGSKDGFSFNNSTEVCCATDDRDRFNLLEFGGGNVRYDEFARPTVITLDGKQYVFYADADCVKLIHFCGRTPEETIELQVPNVIAVAAGHIQSQNTEDLVMLQVNGLDDQDALVFFGSIGYTTPAQTRPVKTPRDVLLCDFSGNGHDDIVVVQGRSATAFTSESLLFCTDENGTVHQEPRRFVTHNCVEAFVGDFNASGKKSLVFINQQESTSYGHVPVYVYLGSENGFTPENRLEFPGHSAGTMLPIDFNDDGYTDILVLQNAEDQPHKAPPADLYWGSKDGFSEDNMIQIPAPLAWGGHCADLNKDGYLDLIATCGNHVRIYYGTENGYSEDNMQLLYPTFEEGEGARCGALWPALADLNGNGYLDLVVPISWQNYSRIYWGGPDGYSDERSTKLPIECALTCRIADLNKDGYPDIIFGSRVSVHKNLEHEGSVTIFWGGPNGYSGFNCCVLPSYQSNSLTIADFTGDGWLDIFASSYFNGKERDINSFIYWNDHGNFSVTNRKRLFAHSSSAAWACDFNEDGYVDIFLSHHRAYGNHNTESAIWWNGPDGFKEESRSWLPTIGPHDMIPNDVGDIIARSPEEYYISPVGKMDSPKAVSWEGEIPIKTWVNCQIRTAHSEEALAAASFIGPDGTENSRFTSGQEIPAELICGPYLQIKLYLGSVNSGNTPRITEIIVE